MKSIINFYFKEYEEVARASFVPEQLKVLEQIATFLVQAFKKGRKVLLCGNGGSAADAQHVAAEFIGRFRIERKSLPAIALTTDTSILTSLANDYAYERVFSRQVEGLGEQGDILVGISTSGNSKNVLEAFRAAKAKGITTIAFTGKSGGMLKNMADVNFSSASSITSHIQEAHIAAFHAICEAVEQKLFPARKK